MPRLNNLRAVLFDFDGTLMPSLPLWLKAYQATLHNFGIDIPDDDVLRRCLFRDWEHVAAEFNVFTAEQLQAQLAIGLKQAFAEAALFPLAEDVLKHCREHGLRVALVTSSPRALVVDVIGRLLIHELFDYVVCGDDVKNYKPHPEPVLAALASFNLDPHEAIMIGDSHVDILAAKRPVRVPPCSCMKITAGFIAPQSCERRVRIISSRTMRNCHSCWDCRS